MEGWACKPINGGAYYGGAYYFGPSIVSQVQLGPPVINCVNFSLNFIKASQFHHLILSPLFIYLLEKIPPFNLFEKNWLI